MLQHIQSNPCTRCGKQRVNARTYRQKVGESYVVHTEYTCPDPNCQDIVNDKLDKERLVRERAVNMNQNRQNRGNTKRTNIY